jgi:protein MAK11
MSPYVTKLTNRVKSISLLPFYLPSVDSAVPTKTVLLTSVSTDGFVNLYDLGSLSRPSTSGIEGSERELGPAASYDTKGTRLTCVFLADGGLQKPEDDGQGQGMNAGDKRKSVAMEADDGEDDDSEDEEEEGADIYDQGSGDEEEEEDGVEVEFEDEDEDEEEEEDEGEYED